MIDELIEPDREKDVKDFDEWLTDEQPDLAIILFEEYLYSTKDEIVLLASDYIVGQIKYAKVNDQLWTAYWDMYNYWAKYEADRSAQDQLQGDYEIWVSEQ